MIRSLFGLLFGGAREARALGQTVTSVAEVFRPNATRAMELGHDAYKAAHASHTAEFQFGRGGWFDSAVNGLNRLPRPLLALGTLALFVYAMADPDGFALRMLALSAVPEPLWWLLGAVVAFYFGAREAHHLRCTRPAAPAPMAISRQSADATPQHHDSAANPALAEWKKGNA
ncbi:holin family protein [Roseinatronobacter alkalisoli]|uniref:Holin family protein n=1 Tax=Roseinatronobacter alkalisoli TaxID=3028235 RepID=A0ABT5TB55_9RHOB|nr:holin family protein [Roseinatronobacter sp. HJB301]MDD7971417.1 holin family protein [Roseinatronobacter sp. HJB301]